MKPPESPDEIIAPCYVIGGEERTLTEKWVLAIREQIFADGGEDFNLDRFDARQVSDVEVISQAARTLPMLSARRLVLVRNAEIILGMAKDRVKPLIGYIKDPDPSTVLVLVVGGKITKSSALAKTIRKHAQIVELNTLKEREVLPWLKQEAKEKNIVIEHDAAMLLCESLGTDLNAHLDALERLKLFVGANGSITASAVSELVIPARTKTIWEFLDALGNRSPGQALQCVSQLLEQGDVPLQILPMVARLYRQLTIGHTILSGGGSTNEAAATAGVPGFRARSFAAQCNQYSARELEHARQTIYELDGRLKSSRIDGRRWLEHGILEMSVPRR